MGRNRRSRTHSSAKNQAKSLKTKRYKRDLDQIANDLRPENLRKIEEKAAQTIDEDLPGLGRHPCIPCSQHFISPEALQSHQRSKVHKRRLRDLKEEPFTVEEAEAAAGLGVDNGKRSKKVDVAAGMEVEGQNVNAVAT